MAVKKKANRAPSVVEHTRNMGGPVSRAPRKRPKKDEPKPHPTLRKLRAPRRAREMADVFEGMRGDSFRHVGSNSLNAFIKLLERFDEWRQSTGITVDPLLYIQAMAATDSPLSPAQLFSPDGLRIYLKHLDQVAIPEAMLTDAEWAETVDSYVLRLSRLRGESEEEVRKLLDEFYG